MCFRYSNSSFLYVFKILLYTFPSLLNLTTVSRMVKITNKFGKRNADTQTDSFSAFFTEYGMWN